MNWDDLYSYLIENYQQINPKEKVFTGFGNFICHTKYNDRRENMLNFLSKTDEEGVADTAKSRSSARQIAKNDKDAIRSIESGDRSIFNSLGMTIDSRMQMVEIAQLEDIQRREEVNSNLNHLTNKNKLLLEERQQQISLAKIISPKYDPNNEHWAQVLSLTKDLENVKNEIAAEEKNKKQNESSYTGSNVAKSLLNSVNMSDSPKKRKYNEDVDTDSGENTQKKSVS